MSSDIELEIAAGSSPLDFNVRVVRSAGGDEPSAVAHLDVPGLLSRRAGLESVLLSSAVRARRTFPASEEPLRALGAELFSSVFAGSVAGAYRASLGVARERGESLRVVLRVQVPSLVALPWEALFDPETESYLCRKEPLVRHVPAPFPAPPLHLDPPLRVLVVIATPRSFPPLNVEAERSHLIKAVAAPAAAGLVELEIIPHATWAGVHERLLADTWHVLHFVGHGGYDLESDEGVLVLEDESGDADPVHENRLVDLLDEARPTPRLVVLNACATAHSGTTDLFSGTAAALVRSGVQAVAAMQFTVSDIASVAFSRGFYAALARGRGVDDAVRSGRVAILGNPGSLEWISPVLYLRGNVPQLFAVALDRAIQPDPSIASGGKRSQPGPSADVQAAGTLGRTPSVTPSPGSDAAYLSGIAAFFSGRLEEAERYLVDAERRFPDDPQLQRRLSKTRQDLKLKRLYADGCTAFDRGDWAAAADILEQLTNTENSYREAATLLALVRSELERERLCDDVRALFGARDWPLFFRSARELHELAPEMLDFKRLETAARQQLAARRIDAAYSEALIHLDRNEVDPALRLLSEIAHEHPGYRDTDALLMALAPAPTNEDVNPQPTPWYPESVQEAENTRPAARSTTISTSPRVESTDNTLDVRARWATFASPLMLDTPATQALLDTTLQTLVLADPHCIIVRALPSTEMLWQEEVDRGVEIQCVTLSTDGTCVGLLSNQGHIRMWRTADKHLSFYKDLGLAYRGALALNTDGSRMAVVLDGSLIVWDTQSGDPVFTQHAALSRERAAVALSSQGAVATILQKGVAVWGFGPDPDVTFTRYMKAGFSKHALKLSFTPSGELLAVACRDGVVLLDPRAGKAGFSRKYAISTHVVMGFNTGGGLMTMADGQVSRTFDVANGTLLGVSSGEGTRFAAVPLDAGAIIEVVKHADNQLTVELSRI